MAPRRIVKVSNCVTELVTDCLDNDAFLVGDAETCCVQDDELLTEGISAVTVKDADRLDMVTPGDTVTESDDETVSVSV